MKEFKELVRVPVTEEMKKKFQEDCHWNRETMSEVMRRFIESYRRIK